MSSRILLLVLPCCAARLLPVESPPLLNSPIFSLATLNADGSTNMNILTYATPVGVDPRLWAISLFRKTRSHANFASRGGGMLQLLRSQHVDIVYVLGGISGADTDKASACAEAGFAWLDAGTPDGHRILPECASYIQLTQMGDLVDAGTHDLAICRVDGFLVPDSADLAKCTDGTLREWYRDALSSVALRDAGIISDQGRAIARE